MSLANVAQLARHHPMHQNVANSIPGQRTHPAYVPNPQEGMCKRQMSDVSLSYQFLSRSFSSSHFKYKKSSDTFDSKGIPTRGLGDNLDMLSSWQQ